METFPMSGTIATNIFGPLAIEEMSKDLFEATFVTVRVDASSIKSVKRIPILIRFSSHKSCKDKITKRTLRQGINARNHF
jgi:hypothetical protein